MENTTIELIKEKIKKIDIELVHEVYLDGWTISYLRNRKIELENKLLLVILLDNE